MADKKKMSVADILAAARKVDGDGGEDSPAPAQTDATPPEESSAVPSSAAPPKKSSEKKAKPTPAKSASGGRPSVAEMMAMARGQDKGAEEKKPAAKAKSPAKDSPKPAAKKASKGKAAATPKDTASILAAARSASRKGPMSKAEAAKSGVATKPKIAVPPMPEKPSYARAKAVAKPISKSNRRGFIAVIVGSFLAVGFAALAATGGLSLLALARFMFPNVLREPPSQFKVGFPGNFAAGQVETKFKAQFGIWIVNSEYNGELQLVALKSVCTHLGCTPNWLEAEQKFKCPCHGSGFYKDGINFEGPAPRPLERYAIGIADDGQVMIDKSRTFQEEMGGWADSASFISG